MKLLLTGASGFIGSHMLEHFLVSTDWNIVCIASWKHKGTPERILEVLSGNESWKDRVTVITHDLEAPIPFRTASKIGEVDYIVNCASESHVDRSIEQPRTFIQNNVNLVLSVLDFARLQPNLKAFVQVSTDEVYGVAPDGVNHKEWSVILPSNPYSASKAAQEAICIAYWRTYGIPLIITNTMNNFGEMQDPEKYIAKAIRQISKGEKVTVHGTPDNIGSRFYLHARNHADGVLFLLKNHYPVKYSDDGLYLPSRFNIVGDVELNNLEVVQEIGAALGEKVDYEFVDFHATRPGHDRRYALDGSLLKSIGWKPPFSFRESLERYIKWTLKHPEWL